MAAVTEHALEVLYLTQRNRGATVAIVCILHWSAASFYPLLLLRMTQGDSRGLP